MWKVSKNGVFSGLYLDTFHTVVKIKSYVHTVNENARVKEVTKQRS